MSIHEDADARGAPRVQLLQQRHAPADPLGGRVQQLALRRTTSPIATDSMGAHSFVWRGVANHLRLNVQSAAEGSVR